MPPQEAAGRGDAALERMELTEHRTKKVGELSRGLRQLLQFAATIQHEPEFLILDEPFSGLDPVNVRPDEERGSASCVIQELPCCSRPTR